MTLYHKCISCIYDTVWYEHSVADMILMQIEHTQDSCERGKNLATFFSV